MQDDNTTEWTLEAWQAHIDCLIERQRVIAELLRGRSYVSTAELEAIYSDLPADEKWPRINAIRKARAEKRRSKISVRRNVIHLTPVQWLCKADMLRAF